MDELNPLTGELHKLPAYEQGARVTITGPFTETSEFYVKDCTLIYDDTDDISDDDGLFWFDPI